MMWPLALVALMSMQLACSRALKTPSVLDADEVLNKQLQVENEALTKKNQKLEAMMQMARAEVHRMDTAARHRRSDTVGDGDVLRQEISDLKQKLQVSESDKTDLVQTLRRMLSKNSTKMFQRQVEQAQQANMALEMKLGEERKMAESESQEANRKIAEASEKCQSITEAAKGLKEENDELRQKLEQLHTDFSKLEATNKDLSSDKANLMVTMQSLMRDNMRLKNGLQDEKNLEAKDASEMAAFKATLAKAKKPPAPVAKAAKKVTKEAASNHIRMHHPSTKVEMARRRAMNDYMLSTEVPSDGDDASEKVAQVQQQGQLFTKGKVGTHLSDWLGMKSQDVKAVAGDTKSNAGASAAPHKSKAEGDDMEADEILKEAKANLASMESSVSDDTSF